MSIRVCWFIVGMFGSLQLAGARLVHETRQYTTLTTLVAQPPHYRLLAGSKILAPHYSTTLRFNVYSFSVTAADSGRVREVLIKAYRGELLLTNFRVRVDGAVVGAQVADLDNNRFPELYIYSTSDGSGSFGHVYGWQFLPERKADIIVPNWRMTLAEGYMGHDSLWVERDIFCRKYPIYRSGDANAEPSGGFQMMRYRLKPAGVGFSLVAD